jgi:hypothetical protein
MKYDKFFGMVKIRFSSAYSKRDQWSDLSIILQFLNISSVKLVFIGLVESGESSIRDLMC